MKPPLYKKIYQLSIGLVNASSSEDTRQEWLIYNKLRDLCLFHENTDLDHPLQWEALADFTVENKQAVSFYKKALQVSELLSLREYSASINLALAERYLEVGETDLALEFAYQADDIAKTTKDLELRKQVSNFLLDISKRSGID